MNKRLMVLVTLLSSILVTVPTSTAAERVRRKNFAQEWIRCHPFTLMALVQRPSAVADDLYAKARLNTFLAWKRWQKLCPAAVRMKLPWHFNLRKGKTLADEGYDEATIKALIESNPGSEGVLVWDEPKRTDMKTAGEIVAWFKKNYPHLLVYSNAYPCGRQKGSVAKHWGGKWLGPGRYEQPPKPYTYDDYMNDFVTLIKPDVVMVDVYPFPKPPEGEARVYQHKAYFRTLGGVRRAALKAHLPYWVFVQAYAREGGGGRRYPSESDMRMQVFCALAHGFTGIAYFTWGPGFRLGLLQDEQNPKPTYLYYDVVRLNEEVLNVGKALRYLTSTDVKYVSGRHVQGDYVVPNPVPWGIENYPGSSRVSKRIRRIKVEGYGRNKNALVGFFKFRDGPEDQYFMLVNLDHGEGLRAADTKTNLTVWFDPSVKMVARLSRETGEVDLLPVIRGQLKVSLPGGTGDLFKIAEDRVFPGLGPTPRFDPFVRR